MMNQDNTTDQIDVQSSTKESSMKSINTTHTDNDGDDNDNDNDAHYQADKTTAILPGQYDVLFGRSKKVKAHSGNIMFDQLIELSYNKYESANRVIKTEISEQIITAIQESGGRFLKKISSAGQHNNNGNNSDGDYYYYEEVEWNLAREKIAHCFRRIRKKSVSTSSNSTTALFASRTSTTSNTSSRTSSFSSNNSNGFMDPVLLQCRQQIELMPNRLDRVSLSASMNNSTNGLSMDNGRKDHMLLQRQSELVSLSALNDTNESYFNDYDNSSRNTCFGNVVIDDGRDSLVTNKNSSDPFDMYMQLKKKQKEEYQPLQQQQHKKQQHQETITSVSRSHTFGSMSNIGSLSELASGCGDIDMILSGGTDHGHTAMINGMHNKSWTNPNPDSRHQEDKNEATTTTSSCPVEQFKSSFGF